MMTASKVLGLALALALAAAATADEKAAEKKIATLVVKTEPDSTVWVDDEEQDKAEGDREFRTPPLEPGKKYYYLIKARWEPNNYTKITRTRKVIVEAGKQTKVDLTVRGPKDPLDDIQIRYVPTPQNFVDEMMKLGKVGEGDVVFDLGCGDGRLVVTAVKAFKAKRAIGVDIDPERIKECKENAKRAEVEDKVEFRQQDAFKIPDLEKATVVTLYMSDELNEQLWPILQKRLSNGARIVTHRFLMGTNKPEVSKELSDSKGYTEKIHLWTVKKDEPKKDEPKKDEPKKDEPKKDD